MKKIFISIFIGIILTTSTVSVYANAPGVIETGKISGITNAFVFSDGLSAIEKDNLWGFMNEKGEIVIEPQYSFVQVFHEDVAWVKKDDHIFFIDKNGNPIIDTDTWKNYDFEFSEGLLAVKNNDDKWGFIDKKGNIVIEPQWDEAESFSNGLAAVSLNGKYGYINTSGQLIITPTWEYVSKFNESGTAFVIQNMDNPEVGFINTKGEYIATTQYTACHGYGENLLTVCQNGKWGFIDVNGNTIIEPQYTDASVFSNGLANVEIDGVGAYINKEGNVIWGPNEMFSQSVYLGGFSDGFVRVGKNKYGIMDLNGNVIIDLAYDSCSRPDNGLIIAQDGKTYYIYDVSNAKPDSSTPNINDAPVNNSQDKSIRNRTYDKVIQAYNELKDSLNNPDSLQIIGIKIHDTDIIFKYRATNSYGATVTDYALYSDYEIVHGEMGSSLAHSYYISSASEEISWTDIEDYLKSIN